MYRLYINRLKSTRINEKVGVIDGLKNLDTQSW